VNIIDHYDVCVRSPSLEMQLPSVVSLKEYVPAARHPAFTRFNVFLRDRFTCQYCGEPYPSHDLTFDHLVPRSRGGRTIWTNVVTACATCNLWKGNRLPRESGMYPRHRPVQPTTYMLQENAGATTSTGTPSSTRSDPRPGSAASYRKAQPFTPPIVRPEDMRLRNA
jgi:5-methylcytosine-specific restriction endonuclease McrA